MLSTHLLAWNPAKYPWGSLEDELRDVDDGVAPMRWSVGNVTSIEPGDRLFLIRLGSDPKGIIGSGWAISRPSPAPHWDPTRAANGAMSNRIDLELDLVAQEPLIPLQQLNQSAILSDYHWSTQMSGVRIPENVAAELEVAWAAASGLEETGFADESTSESHFAEGASERVFVNRYERSSAARAACLAHYGRTCTVCEARFAAQYGSAAPRLVQVHHLNPLGVRQGEGQVDPVRDLRPLCPSCHALVHLQSPPLSIEAARRLLGLSVGGA